VAAAFIGPGTVTTATLAGVRYGTGLLWALLFGTLATMILQEMAARLGLVSGRGLGEAIARRFEGRTLRPLALGLVLAAIVGGNAAYETGNLLGGALGLQGVFGGDPRLWAVGIGGLAALLLASGSYRLVERAMIGLVALMSLTFLATAVALRPDAAALLQGLLVPRLPDAGAVLVAIGLVGTTVVPYNLFLHASAMRERWSGVDELPSARFDLVLSIGLGGVVSMAILVAGASASGGEGGIRSAADMARALEPVLGRWATVVFAVGLFAAGITSSITAPLAAAWATAGVMGWPRDLRDPRLRRIWGGVLLVGVALALAGLRPVPAILFAQAANGLLLPAVALFLLLVVNDPKWMQQYRNRLWSNLLGGIVVAVTTVLGARALLSVLGLI
jgi:Mn2+/Fe2+ NRAMP family transporter